MKYDAFSRCHPAVNFIFFLGTIGCCVILQHPAYLITSIAAAIIYSFMLCGRKTFRFFFSMLPLCILIAALNPLFNTAGRHVLFALFDRPYTFEALVYGIVTAAMLLGATLWFTCYNKVMTNDKFTSLFSPILPSVSLLLVMVLRLIPKLSKKARQITVARRCIGKGLNENSSAGEKVRSGIRILSAVTDDALDGSIVTADSMRARGYGRAKRTSFQIYRMQVPDWLLLFAQLSLLLAVVLSGHSAVRFTPVLMVQNVSWGFGAYCLYVFLPIILHCKEALQWRILRSKI